MIRFEGVCKYFLDDQKTALEDINFTIGDGEFVFVTGHSGSGKTTLLRLLLREYQPNEGKVFFDEQDLARLSRRKVAKHRQRVGVVFQDYQLLDDLTVWENIALPLVIAGQEKKEIKSRIGELLKLLDLQGYEQTFPVQLSGGEAQRIGLARALATAPKVIFADEPTGNLDNKNASDIVSLLESVNRYGTTVMVATHNLVFLDQVPGARQLELEKGKIVKDTRPQTKRKTEEDNQETREKKPTTQESAAPIEEEKENKKEEKVVNKEEKTPDKKKGLFGLGKKKKEDK